jgi:hypothetical protein
VLNPRLAQHQTIKNWNRLREICGQECRSVRRAKSTDARDPILCERNKLLRKHPQWALNLLLHLPAKSRSRQVGQSDWNYWGQNGEGCPLKKSFPTVSQAQKRHARTSDKSLILLARSERFELPTLGFEVRCSIQLSYERVRGVDYQTWTDRASSLLQGRPRRGGGGGALSWPPQIPRVRQCPLPSGREGISAPRGCWSA